MQKLKAATRLLSFVDDPMVSPAGKGGRRSQTGMGTNNILPPTTPVQGAGYPNGEPGDPELDDSQSMWGEAGDLENGRGDNVSQQ
jgi:hypothetical protein